MCSFDGTIECGSDAALGDTATVDRQINSVDAFADIVSDEQSSDQLDRIVAAMDSGGLNTSDHVAENSASAVRDGNRPMVC